MKQELHDVRSKLKRHNGRSIPLYFADAIAERYIMVGEVDQRLFGPRTNGIFSS